MLNFLKKGFKVAICDQVSDPSLPGIVKREVTRVVTPGTVVEDEILDQKKNNFLACIAEKNNVFGLVFLDTSTGDFFVTEVNTRQRLIDELYKLSPAEVLFSKKVLVSVDLIDYVKKNFHTSVSSFELFEDATKVLLDQFNVKTLKGFGVETLKVATIAAGHLIEYVQINEKVDLKHIVKITPVLLDQYMHLDETTIKNLELVVNNYDGDKQGSLLGILDKTNTSMGARLLVQWLLRPLLDQKMIQQRLDAVELLYKDKKLYSLLETSLKEVFDVERILGKIVLRKAFPRDLVGLKHTMRSSFALRDSLSGQSSGLLKYIHTVLESKDHSKVHDMIDAAIDEEATEEGKIIKKGYKKDMDELRKLMFEGKDWLVEYEKREQEATGIGNLKVRFNKITG